ncbi:dynamin GTPase [Saccharata proteae CBS 121410]|uniref:Dynamin GTPase n=1 Tax=Saccharata proteae CBS 121410 TaxID=1314787 RepID=A0A9P4I3E2_9PEZI|nr:dynamin GTPase [Saccharata proteae CBS 121410]
MSPAAILQQQELSTEQVNAAKGLGSAKSTNRLNQIDRVRAIGVGDHVALPQLVVCGDQSCGKSSVLEAVTGVPFPRQDGLCTRFATEIILRHDSTTERICASINPRGSRGAKEQERLRRYKRQLKDIAELSTVVEEVSTLMGLRGVGGNTNGPSFASDTLRIEVVGSIGLHLTIVDLPGLIAVHSDEQENADVTLVSDLINRYLKSSRTIILAVVQANNDIANQAIIQRARKFDPKGQRTVGIITKPDLVNKGTENRIALLSRNEDTTRLKLGFFLLKNPSPEELKFPVTAAERKREEKAFFQSTPWKEQSLDPERVGSDALTSYLQQLLDQHIERELPKVRKEILDLLGRKERALERMGEARSTSAQFRMFLTRISMRFSNLLQAALDGNYIQLSFEIDDSKKPLHESSRLRAQIQAENQDFSERMRMYGQKRRIIQDIPQKDNSPGEDPQVDEPQEDSCGQGQILLKSSQFNAWIEKVNKKSRGCELPGNSNHFLLAELFLEQSSLWNEIASVHMESLAKLTANCIARILDSVVGDGILRDRISDFIAQKLRKCTMHAHSELARLISDEKRQPMTYNHYYTDNIQKARQDSMEKRIRETMGDSLRTVDRDPQGRYHEVDLLKSLSTVLRNEVIVDMKQQACQEAKAGLDAYYKVARKTFVDNVCRQCIERHMISPLPEVFSPATVMELSDTELEKMAGESQEQQTRRRALEELVEGLRQSLNELQV